LETLLLPNGQPPLPMPLLRQKSVGFDEGLAM
jgi:hypothetical protein